MPEMHVVCAWCGKTISGATAGGPISHGICDDCVRIVLADDGHSLQTLLEGFRVPVLVLGANAELITGNNAAKQALGKSIASIQGYLPGDVISCREAVKAGGCGQQGHCRGCVIRNSVEQTLASGKPVPDAVAEQLLVRDGREVPVRFRISTRLLGGMVLIRIEEIADGK
jgi:PAS domain-containing protein